MLRAGDAAPALTPVPLLAWVASVRASLAPPVGNKLLFGAGQHKVMAVGGPNARRDFHVEAGEEFFVQLEGELELLVVARAGAAPRAVRVCAGEAFLLPARVPHSPQRGARTVGLVIERERLRGELDVLRWYTAAHAPLYEEAFACTDLGAQLRPVIERFNASAAARTGAPPAPGEVGAPCGDAEPDAPEFAAPFSLREWVAAARAGGARGAVPVWGAGEAFLWQLEGAADVGDAGLTRDDVMLVPARAGARALRVADGGATLVVTNARVRGAEGAEGAEGGAA